MTSTISGTTFVGKATEIDICIFEIRRLVLLLSQHAACLTHMRRTTFSTISLRNATADKLDPYHFLGDCHSTPPTI